MTYYVRNKETDEVSVAVLQRLIIDVAQGLKIDRELAKVKIELADINNPLKFTEFKSCWVEK